jgi:hypothetical protein
MKKSYNLVLTILVTMTIISESFGQDAPRSTPLEISGSGDLYYKYDFSDFKATSGSSNISTSFATDQNSISLGMLNLILKKSAGKASFVGDVSFGPRGQYQSIPTGDVSRKYFHTKQ